MWAGLDPDGYFRRQAGRRDAFTVVFPGLGPVRFHATAQAARDILSAPATEVEAPTPNPIEPIALRIIVIAIFGVESADSFDELAEVATGLIHANRAALMLPPLLRKHFAGRGPWAWLVRLRTRFDELLSEHIETRRSDTGESSVLGALLAGNKAVDLDPDDLHQQLRTLVVAGHDTTAGALMWALYHIHREPGVHDRVLAELDTATTPEALPELPYLSAVVSETLRMRPAVPIVMRRLTAPLTVDGVRWSPGEVVGVALPAVHFDPSRWPHPYRFDPGRFLGHTPTPFEYLPFGGGFRRCPGAAFASYELAISIGALVKTVELRMPPRQRRAKPPRSVPRGIAVVPRREVRLDVINRR